MNGQAFGALADGLMGGYKLGNMAVGAKSGKIDKPDMKAPASGSTAAGYSGDLSNFQATPTGSVGAETVAPAQDFGGSWSTLRGIATGLSDMFTGQKPPASPMADGVGVQQPGMQTAAKNNGLNGGLNQ